MTTHEASQEPEQWQPASGTEILQLSKDLKKHKTRRQMLRASLGVVASLMVASTGWWLVRSQQRGKTFREYEFAGITCTQVNQKMEAVMQKTLPKVELAQLRDHVNQCPNCVRFEKMLDEATVSS